VCVVDVDEGNNEGVCDDVLDMEKIITWVLEISKTVINLQRMVITDNFLISAIHLYMAC
jgi:hypothetical protein